MEESQVVDIWLCFKESIDKKHLEVVAEKYIDLCADLGTSDITFRDSLGNCGVLDDAINYYLDVDDDDDWDDEENEDW